MRTAPRSGIVQARRDLAVPLILLAIGAGGAGARAQSVNYGVMEQMFGEPVTTSVTGKPQRATDAPANIEIITQDDIRRSGATTIPEVLQSSPASMSGSTASAAPMSASAATTRPPIRI